MGQLCSFRSSEHRSQFVTSLRGRTPAVFTFLADLATAGTGTVNAQSATDWANHTPNNIQALQPIIHAKCPSTFASSVLVNLQVKTISQVQSKFM